MAVAVCLALAGCTGAAPGMPPAPSIRLSEGARPGIEVVHLRDDQVQALNGRTLTADQWAAVLSVSVGEGQPPMLGAWATDGFTLRFTPMFPLDPGRPYRVVFDERAIPDLAGTDPPLVATVALPARDLAPTTSVTHVFPSADAVPANQLRLYIHFSAPMGRRGGVEHVTLLDDAGQPVVDPFLPLDAEFWNGDRTRYTVFFDPGRQKRGILPNQEMGRSLEPGRRYTLVVSREWRDGEGLPLKEEYRRAFTVGEPDEAPLDPRAWTVTRPVSGTRDPVVVTFAEPLDHGLLLRALGVTGSDGQFVDGDVQVTRHETQWRFTPRQTWGSGAYQLVALSMLEDLAGNRIGRAFEVDNFDRSDPVGEPERTVIPLR